MIHLLIAILATALVIFLTLIALFYAGLTPTDVKGVRLREIPFQLWVAITAILLFMLLVSVGAYYVGPAFERANEHDRLIQCQKTGACAPKAEY